MKYDVKDIKLADKGKLNAMSVKIDKLTPEQKKYFASWEMGM